MAAAPPCHTGLVAVEWQQPPLPHTGLVAVEWQQPPPAPHRPGSSGGEVVGGPRASKVGKALKDIKDREKKILSVRFVAMYLVV